MMNLTKTRSVAMRLAVAAVAITLAGHAAANPFASRRAEKEAANAALVCKVSLMEGAHENVLNAEKLSAELANVVIKDHPFKSAFSGRSGSGHEVNEWDKGAATFIFGKVCMKAGLTEPGAPVGDDAYAAWVKAYKEVYSDYTAKKAK
jgi:hypothetical protein